MAGITIENIKNSLERYIRHEGGFGNIHFSDSVNTSALHLPIAGITTKREIGYICIQGAVFDSNGAKYTNPSFKLFNRHNSRIGFDYFITDTGIASLDLVVENFMLSVVQLPKTTEEHKLSDMQRKIAIMDDKLNKIIQSLPKEKSG